MIFSHCTRSSLPFICYISSPCCHSPRSARWIGSFGFSIGIDDVQPSQRLEREKSKALERGYGASGAHIAAFNEGRLALQPGCNAAQTLEAEITGELNRIREEAGKVRGGGEGDTTIAGRIGFSVASSLWFPVS